MITDLQRCEMEQAEAASYLTDPAKCAAWAAEYHCEVETARAGALLSAWDWLMEEAILRLEGQASSLGIEQFGSDPQSARCRNSESSVSESSVDSYGLEQERGKMVVSGRHSVGSTVPPLTKTAYQGGKHG